MGKSKSPEIAKIILKKKNIVGRFMWPDVMSYSKATVSSTVWQWYKHRCPHWENRIKSLETDIHIWPIYFQQRCPHNSWEKIVFATNNVERTGLPFLKH